MSLGHSPGQGMDPLQAFIGVKTSHLVAGIAGGVVRAFLSGSDMMTAIASVVIGSLTAGYLTTPVYKGLAANFPATADPSTEHAVGFLVGLTAMLICEGVLRYARQWSKNPRLPGNKP